MLKKKLKVLIMSSALCLSTTAMADWPVAVTDKMVAHPEQFSVGMDVLINDIGSALDIIAVNAWSENGARLSRIDTRGLVYRPPSDFEGEDGFWYVIEDSEGRTNAARVSVNVLPVSSALPAPQEDQVQTPKDTTIRIDVLRNDLFSTTMPTGESNNFGEITKFDVLSENGGKVEKVSVYPDSPLPVLRNQLRYTPPAGFSGIDTFEYAIKDTSGTVEQTTKVTIDVLNNPDITTPYPAGNPDTFSFNCAFSGCRSPSIDVLKNDEGTNLLLRLNSAWSLRGGQVTTGASRVGRSFLRYRPANGFSGEDKVWYVIEDEYGRRNWSVVTINVERP